MTILVKVWNQDQEPSRSIAITRHDVAPDGTITDGPAQTIAAGASVEVWVHQETFFSFKEIL